MSISKRDLWLTVNKKVDGEIFHRNYLPKDAFEIDKSFIFD